MQRIHITDKPITRLISRRKQDAINNKPKGLWYSINNEWLEWHDNHFNSYKPLIKYVLKIDLAKILTLNTPKEMRRFSKEYLYSPYPEAPILREINWTEVTKDYMGIEINPYQYGFRLNIKYTWYYGWDVASGCIWNKKAILKLKRS